MTTTTRQHPDLFTPDEAAEYLRVTSAQLPTLERDFGLKGWTVGKVKVYWRKDLDATAYKMVGERPPVELLRKEGLKLAQESA